MSALDVLLKADTRKLKSRKTIKVKLPRLSERVGENVVFEVGCVPNRFLAEVMDVDTKKPEEAFERSLDLIVEAVIDPNFHDQKLYKDKLGCATPNDAVDKLLDAGEIKMLADAVGKACGSISQNKMDEKVKN